MVTIFFYDFSNFSTSWFQLLVEGYFGVWFSFRILESDIKKMSEFEF